MKKIILALPVLFFLFFVVSCNQNKNQSDSSVSSSDTTLALNNGAKWVADSITVSNYVNLRTMTNMFAVAPYPSINNYQVYGNDMGKGLNKMLSECKMKGADHEALHRWLEPVIHHSNELKNISDTAEARKLFNTLHERVDIFYNYFTEGQK